MARQLVNSSDFNLLEDSITLPTTLSVMSSPIEISPHWKLTLDVGAELGVPIQMKVVKETMRTVNTTWDKMLDAKTWSVPEKVFEFPADNPEAMVVVLHIAHAKFEKLPKKLSKRLVMQIAILCDKYDLSTLLQPFVRSWTDGIYSIPEKEILVFVSYTFKLMEHFTTAVQHLVPIMGFRSQGVLQIGDRVFREEGQEVLNPVLGKSLLFIAKSLLENFS